MQAAANGGLPLRCLARCMTQREVVNREPMAARAQILAREGGLDRAAGARAAEGVWPVAAPSTRASRPTLVASAATACQSPSTCSADPQLPPSRPPRVATPSARCPAQRSAAAPHAPTAPKLLPPDSATHLTPPVPIASVSAPIVQESVQRSIAVPQA